jgi:hypothetical protein
MKIYLSATTRVKVVKSAFNKEFPYLKLEFFRKKHVPGTANGFYQMVEGNPCLIDVTGTMREAVIDIKPHQTVAEVEELFQNKFNLPIQVFRKSRNVWMETILTDHYTLTRQNKMGREACNAIYDFGVLL